MKNDGWMDDRDEVVKPKAHRINLNYIWTDESSLKTRKQLFPQYHVCLSDMAAFGSIVAK